MRRAVVSLLLLALILAAAWAQRQPRVALWLRSTGAPPTGSSEGRVQVALVDSHPMAFIGLSGGEFDYRRGARKLRLRVSPFVIGETEVTQAQWREVMGSNPSRFSGGDRPVERVSWCDALRFANALSEYTGFQAAYSLNEDCSQAVWDRSADGFRLPTSAEWEYAARAGRTDSLFNNKVPVGWKMVGSLNGGALRGTMPVGQLEPNDWGLHDGTGNVWEWTWARGSGLLASSPWAATGARDWERAAPVPGRPYTERRVLRGCGWDSPTDDCGLSVEAMDPTKGRGGATIGVRLARTGAGPGAG